MINSSLCPCLSGRDYATCCQSLHQQLTVAENAEQLMRSRYSAFCLGLVDYLLATLHPSQHQTGEREALQQSITQTHWLGLKLLDHKQTGDLAEVEFAAFYTDDPFGQLHERSHFVCEAGRWLYHHGDFLPPIKPGRNEACFCGSGKKFKQCHGKR
jgi:SEC-C motif domain protein